MTDETKPQILTPEQRDLLTHEQRCEVDTAYHPALLRKLIEDFKTGKTNRRLVAQWEKANKERLEQPPERRLSFPLLPPLKPEDHQNPLCVKEMPDFLRLSPAQGAGHGPKR